MFKKLAIIIISVFLFALNANAGSNNELTINKDEPKEIKDCFEKLNRATFAFNQALDKAVIKPIAKDIENCQIKFKKELAMWLIIYLI